MADDATVVSTPRGKAWRLVAYGVLLVGISLFDLTVASHITPTRRVEVAARVAGIVGLALFGPLTAVVLVRALRPKPAVILTAAGFVDQASAIAVGFVPWRDVLHIGVTTVFGERFVDVRVRDPAALQRGAPAWKRALRAVNRRFWNADVFLPERALPMPAEALVDLMQARAASDG